MRRKDWRWSGGYEGGFRRPWFSYHPEDLVQQVLSVVVQSLSHVWLFMTPWTAARQAFLSFTVSQSLLRLTSIELIMPSSHLFQGPAQTPWTISVPGSAKSFPLETPGAHWVVAFCVMIFHGAGKVLGSRHDRQELEGKYPSSFPPQVDHPRGPQQDWAPAAHSSHLFMNTPLLSFPLSLSEFSGIISQINCSHPSLWGLLLRKPVWDICPCQHCSEVRCVCCCGSHGGLRLWLPPG